MTTKREYFEQMMKIRNEIIANYKMNIPLNKGMTPKQFDYLVKNCSIRYIDLLCLAAFKTIELQNKGNYLNTEFDSSMIEITRKCNYKCAQCYNKDMPVACMPNSTLEKIIDFSINNFTMIMFSGGEPFLDNRLLKIAEKYPDTLFPVFTNGSLLNNSKIQQLINLGNVCPIIGLEGATEKVHEEARQKGCFKNTIDVINKLHQTQITWMCAVVVTAKNYKEVTSSKFINFIESKGAVAVRYHHYFPIKGSNNDFILTSKHYKILNDRLNYIKKNAAFTTITAFGHTQKCKSLIYFDVNGNIKPCAYFHYTFGNINQLNQKALINRLNIHLNNWKSTTKNSEYYCPFMKNQDKIQKLVALGCYIPTNKNQQNNIIDHNLTKIK